MSENYKIWELRDAAKWSPDSQEKRKAIKKLAGYGEQALPSLKEILDVTTYEEIKQACVEAIKGINGRSVKQTKRAAKRTKKS